MRKDIVSGEMKPKKELVRIVKNKENDVSIDPTGKKAGRGAYLSLEVAAAKQAQSERVFDQAFGIKIPAEFYEELVQYVDHQAARKELFGDGAK
ncbi:hypothetical protein FD50_GL000111 [Liquorilactobacillus satsumensis DSM 16230 = JCM 12392]|uniref:YlxR domain-containing protein n=2 Tax=Liquorilactobacillus satsumensis TaxID=259059 RepID=A0A0R1V7T4_9LACO|nr:hypothetical protein FD50_GL000111 [Liquorilactobacillus satsumensis DSM 16230 = JCM 12392]